MFKIIRRMNIGKMFSAFRVYGISVQRKKQLKITISLPPESNRPEVYQIIGKKQLMVIGRFNKSENTFVFKVKNSGVFAIESSVLPPRSDQHVHATGIKIHAAPNIQVTVTEIVSADDIPLENRLIDSIAIKYDNHISKRKERIKRTIHDPRARDKAYKKVEQDSAEMLQEAVDKCKSIYEAEVERENSLLQQASNMQSAFSFITAGLFVIAQIVTDQRGKYSNLSYKQIFMAFSFITGWLLLSLVLATVAQRRFVRKHDVPPVVDYMDYINNNFSELQNRNSRLLLRISEYEAYYRSLRRINDIRVNLVRFSMWSFYASILSGVIYGIWMAIIDGL